MPVSTATAADPIRLGLGGYWVGYMQFGDTQGGDEPAMFKYEGEIWFRGSTRLDNGTTLGIVIELEGWSQAPGSRADQVDEEYIYAEGAWGRLEFGVTDAADENLDVTSKSALIRHGFNDRTFVNASEAQIAANNAGRGGWGFDSTAAIGSSMGDTTKISYYTPRVAGLKLGVSYVPGFDPSAGAATCGFRGGAGPSTACPRHNDSWVNGIDIGANYMNTFGDVEIGLYGGFMHADFSRRASSRDGAWRSWAAGINVTWQGFTLGGGMGRDNNGLKGRNATRWYTTSLFYVVGSWEMSLGWWGGRRNETDQAVAGTGGAPGPDRIDYFEIGANYRLAPGVRLTGGVNYALADGQNRQEQADAWGILLGLAVQF